MAISDLKQNNLKSDNSYQINTKDVSRIVDSIDQSHYNNPIHKYRITNFLYKPPFGLPRNVNVPLIRDISRSIYIYSIINRIIDEIATADWDIVPKQGVEITQELEKTRREMIEFFNNPNSMNIGFEEFVRSLLIDTIVLESGVINKVFNKFGQMVEMKVIDGGVITKNPDIYNTFNDRDDLILEEFNPNFEDTDFNKMNKEVLNGVQNEFRTIYNDRAAYFQYSNFTMASMPIPFGKREIVYIMKNPQPGGVYSYGSPVQASVETALSLIFGGKYNLDYFLNGNTPEGIIKVAGADEETLNAVKEKLLNKMQITDNNFGISRRIGHNLPAVSSDNVEFIPINFTSKDLEIITQSKWFIRLLWMMFGVSPDEMGDLENSNRSTGVVQTKTALRKAYKPYMNLLEYNFTRNILTEFKNGDLFEFKFDDSDLDVTKQKLDIAEQELRLGIKTPEMIAEEFGIDLNRLKESKEQNVLNTNQDEQNQDETNKDNNNNNNSNSDTNLNKDEPADLETKATGKDNLKSMWIEEIGNKYVVRNNEGSIVGYHDTLESAQSQRAGIERNPNEKIKGGRADNIPDEEFDQEQLEKGIEVEYEHTNDRDIAKEIAKDHLTEDKDYYKKLEIMEEVDLDTMKEAKEEQEEEEEKPLIEEEVKEKVNTNELLKLALELLLKEKESNKIIETNETELNNCGTKLKAENEKEDSKQDTKENKDSNSKKEEKEPANIFEKVKTPLELVMEEYMKEIEKVSKEITKEIKTEK